MYSIVILSRNPVNCSGCVTALYRHEPYLQRGRIIVVDDGAKEQAENNCQNITWLQGEKPFIYARNANIGLRYAFNEQQADSVVLLNDDALLETRGGFTQLHERLLKDSSLGILSAVTNSVGNLNQTKHAGYADKVRREPRMLCFVAVCIKRALWEAIGDLDERYVGYGMDDDDYSLRARQAGFKLGVWDGCYVNHTTLKSTFRGEGHGDYRPNLELFKHKWGFDNHGRPVTA